MATPTAIFGTPTGHLKQTKDKWGADIDVPQTFSLTEVTSFGFSFGEADFKEVQGRKGFAIHGGKGKNKIEPTAEVLEVTGAALAAMLGVETVSGATFVYRDQSGVDIPQEYSALIKIRSCKTLHLGKWKSDTSVTIAGTPASTTTASTIPAGSYKVANGVYQFSASDVNKTAVMTYTVAGGAANVTVATTIKIPKSGIYNVQQWSKLGSVKKTGVTNWFTQDDYNLNSAAPAAKHFQAASNGVLVFNSAETATSVTITHTTSGVSASTLIATMPDAGYNSIIDPPSSAVFTSVDHVDLVSDSDTAMTGVAVGDSLAQLSSPSSGKFDVDAGGVFTFASADAGDVVRAYYFTDFEYVRVTPPNNGTFVDDLGVRDSNDLQITRVALTSPISLLHDQYAVDGTGAYYFDSTNRGNHVRIDYRYAVDSGVSFNIENDPMGPTPEFELHVSGQYEGQEWAGFYPRVVIKSIVPAPSQDDMTKFKISFAVRAPRGDDPVATFSMAA